MSTKIVVHNGTDINMPEILANWEAEMVKIMVPGQPGQNVSKTHISTTKLAVACAYHLS
jgi:hypothetical protein